jgi:3,4-dihydroxy 2-butanone 4-phosphate synthase/GTP cyclohydrolase II
MAGLPPAGVICEIMNDDGTMARLPDLVQFAQYHGIKIATIADLIEYRRRTESYVERIAETPFDSIHGGPFRMIVYVNKVAYSEHVALVKGDVSKPGPVPVRMHAVDLLSDTLGDRAGKAGCACAPASRCRAQCSCATTVSARRSSPTSASTRWSC